ncbi:hypothetical protein HIO71_08350 [Chryseobacterium aquaticum]|uniref:Uncharacterized protein n=1 Tax=Chryseobacterium aquaticum TaxID=452084 RepID=A0A848N6G1_9FLAO|nr:MULTISPECIES: hypothetical protein [Chryseobacterium]NMR34220.1 hypothetical protein [Chryseobacterium aquaticum]NRQ46295.1 hypothetical protein [Chryseobacterium sp. C-204]
MNATKNHIEENKRSRKRKAKTITPTIRRINRLDETPERCKRNTKRPTEISTSKPTSYGFLNCTFLPKLKEHNLQKSILSEQNLIQNQIKNSITERDFYQSLSLLAKHYNLDLKSTKEFEFPYNIALAMDDIQKQLKNKVKNWEEIRLIEEKGKTYFISEERYSTGSTLYYIPILPLYRLSKNPKRKHAVQLLQSVCSYLYHVAEIPFYKQQESYLFWMYEMVSEWLTSDDENEETSIYLSEIKQAEQIGDFMEQKIYNQHNLSRFKNHLKICKAKDQFDNECFTLASKIFSLYEQYPNYKIFRNAQFKGETNEFESDGIISMDKYVSFCSEAKGMVFQTLFETVNSEFNECRVMEEPIIIKKFDGSNTTDKNLDFENRIFPLIEELIYILNSFSNWLLAIILKFNL